MEHKFYFRSVRKGGYITNQTEHSKGEALSAKKKQIAIMLGTNPNVHYFEIFSGPGFDEGTHGHRTLSAVLERLNPAAVVVARKAGSVLNVISSHPLEKSPDTITPENWAHIAKTLNLAHILKDGKTVFRSE